MTTATTIPKPDVLQPNLDGIPMELKRLSQWVYWRSELRTNGKGEAKYTKVPYGGNKPFDAGPAKALADQPKSWLPFDAAVSWNQRRGFDGIGFEFSIDDPYFGIDLDKCRDPETGEIDSAAQATLSFFKAAYAEVSPSQTGVKLIGRGRLPIDADGKQITGRRCGKIETYCATRYFALTGHKLPDHPDIIGDCQQALDGWFALTFPEKPQKKNRVTENGHASTDGNGNGHGHAPPLPTREEIEALVASMKAGGGKLANLVDGNWQGCDYPSQSEADLAFCTMAASLCRGDRNRIDAAYRASGLMRDKWERDDYRNDTLDKAIQSVEARGDDGIRLQRKTDYGNAERFRDRHGMDFRFCHPWLKWRHFDGQRWADDDSGSVMLACKETVRSIYDDAQKLEDDDARKSYLQHAIKSEASGRLAAMELLARSELPILPSKFDADLMQLNVANGTLDLRTGELREHRREDYCSKLCPTAYDPEAPSYHFDRFIDAIFDGQQDLIDFIRRLFGSALTGDQRDQFIAICWGTGSNGKTTLFEAFMAMLGEDYAIRLGKDALIAKKNEGHSTERMDLFGRRLAVCSETADGNRIDESFLKDLVGGDRIRGRRMRENTWEYSPTHHIFLPTNHKPIVRGSDHGVWRRIGLIPFTVQFWDADKGESGEPHLQADKTLPAKLKSEAAGILRWAVMGCREWQREGLKVPQQVRAATAEYRGSQDVLQTFLAECCIVMGGQRVKAAEIYGRYRKWMEAGGEYAVSQTRFGEAMTERGFAREHSGGTWYLGLTTCAE
jgi:putative DNA primase/helicase